MPLLRDRVRETTTTVGTGTITLGGAVTGYQSFNTAFTNGETTYYVIQGGTEWEIGIGTIGAGTLARTTVLQSSNADALVPFSAGTKDVFCSYVADRAVTTSDAATLTNKTLDDYTNNIGANSTHFRIKATGTISKGQVVKATGFTPGESAIEVAVVTSATDLALGIAEQALTAGQFGLAVVIGELFDVNTNGLSVGAIIYSNGTGGYTTTKPSSGTYQPLGWVVRANLNNGVIAVNIVAPLYVETSTNTANTAVLRDGSGNFAAGTITATLNGAAPAGSLTGTTLASNVVSSSLTSVGTLSSLTVSGNLTVDTNTLFVDAANNRVGIGTTTPTQPFDVFANANFANTVLCRNADTTTGNYGTQAYFRLDVAGAHIGGLKTTANPLVGLSTPALYLTTAGAYPIAFGLNDSATPSMVLNTSGNVGIGTTSPAARLDVFATSGGEIRFGNSGGTGKLFADGGATFVGSLTNHSLYLQTNNTNRWQISSSGHLLAATDASFDIGASGANRPRDLYLSGNARVGGNFSVGTSSPAVFAEISRATTDAVILAEVLRVSTTGRSAAGGTNNRGALIATFDSSGSTLTSAIGGIRENPSGHWGTAIALYTSNGTASPSNSVTDLVERFRINSSGNVGIGTASPAARLHVATESAGTNDIVEVARIQRNTSGTAAVGLGAGVNFALERADGNIDFAARISSSWSNATSGVAAGYLQFDTAINGTFSERMRIDASGNVGIGTTTPSSFAQFAVLSGATANTAFLASTTANAYSSSSFFSGWSLALRSAANATGNATGIRFASSANGAYEGLFGFVQNASTYGDFVWQSFNGSYGERMRLDASGNLGINNTPSAWGSNHKAINIGGASSGHIVAPGNSLAFGANYYNDNTNFLYVTTGQNATRFDVASNGQFRWFTAPSGTSGNTITFTQAMTLDASGNLGLSAVPNVWDASTTAIQVRNTYIWNPGSATQSFFGTNAYYDTSWKYRSTGAAAAYHQIGAEHRWLSAASGTQGTAITFTQAMTLDASGNLLVGTATAPSASSVRSVLARAGSSYLQLTNTTSTGTGALVGIGSTGAIEFYTHTGTVGSEVYTQRWNISSSGHLLAATDASFDIGASGANRPRNVFVSGTVTAGKFEPTANTTAGNGLYLPTTNQVALSTNGSERFRITDAGNIGINNNAPSNFGAGYTSVTMSNTAAAIYQGTSAGVDVRVQADGGAAFAMIDVNSNHPLLLRTNATERVRVKTGGQVRFVPLAAAPTTNVEDGDVYYDSSTNKLRVRAGGAWVDLH